MYVRIIKVCVRMARHVVYLGSDGFVLSCEHCLHTLAVDHHQPKVDGRRQLKIDHVCMYVCMYMYV
jgi:hypothetical protein